MIITVSFSTVTNAHCIRRRKYLKSNPAALNSLSTVAEDMVTARTIFAAVFNTGNLSSFF